MQLSESGRVVLIDDKCKDVRPLMETLGKNGVPYFYYDGNPTKLPENPLNGIRFIFLDIELKGMEGQEPKTKASGLVGRLKKIISSENGPYVIIFWTRHTEVIDLIIKNCKQSSIPPICWVNLEKSNCFNIDGSYDIQVITNALRNKLLSLGAFQLFIEWENILSASSKQFVSKFTSHINVGDNWSNETSSLFYKLYKAYVEKNELGDQTEKFRCACHLMNRSFLDTLESKTTTNLFLPDGFEIKDGSIDESTTAKINASLLLGNNLLSRPITGCVYLEENGVILEGLKVNLFKEGKTPDNIKLCKVIITPECDLAQNKAIKILNDGNISTLHRIVYGLFYPVSESTNIEKSKLHDRGKDAQFVIGPIWYESNRWLIIIHLSTLTTQLEKCFTGNTVFTLKRDLLFDLQSKAANHVNRLGNCQL